MTSGSGGGRGGRSWGVNVVEGERGGGCGGWGFGPGDGEDAGVGDCGVAIYRDDGADEKNDERGDEKSCVS